MKITWHFDDLEISNVNRKVVSDTIVWLEFIYSDMHRTRSKRQK